MSSTQNSHDKIEKALRDAHKTLFDLGKEEYKPMIGKLEFLIASYNYDKNPVGLYQVAPEVKELLTKIKEEKPRAFKKEIITALEKAMQEA
ncbi:MAG: hypothetical protein RMJ89_11425 [Flammeovirgaceae bacterium]|nr:hypothetical protein [Flammeovirgaceae bacterium]